MSQSTDVPIEATRTDGRLGLVVEDQRTRDLRMVVYADDHVVLLRDESNATSLLARDAFERSLGTRYRVRPDARPAIDGGPLADLRAALKDYEAADGRKAAHKAEALRETVDVFAAKASQPEDSDEPSDGPSDDEVDVTFEEVPGIGPKTAGNLRAHGFVTEADVAAATDEELLGVAGLGPESLAALREFVGS